MSLTSTINQIRDIKASIGSENYNYTVEQAREILKIVNSKSIKKYLQTRLGNKTSEHYIHDHNKIIPRYIELANEIEQNHTERLDIMQVTRASYDSIDAKSYPISKKIETLNMADIYIDNISPNIKRTKRLYKNIDTLTHAQDYFWNMEKMETSKRLSDDLFQELEKAIYIAQSIILVDDLLDKLRDK